VRINPQIKHGSNSLLVPLLLGCSVYLYLNLFYLLRTPFLLSDDQVFFWMDAQRMLDGRHIYQDFIQFTPPGTDVIYLALFKLFGLRLWVTNVLVLALGLAFCWLCFSIASEIMERKSAILTTAFFLVLIYGKLLDATHHCFSVLVIMCAVKLCMGKITTARIFLAGALLGIASFFTQTHAAAALFAFVIFLILKRWRDKTSRLDLLRDEFLLFLGCAVVALLLYAPLVAALGWKGLWYFQVTYVMRYVVPIKAPMMGLPGPFNLRGSPKLLQVVFVYLSLPIVYLLTSWRCWRERYSSAFPWNGISLLSLVGFFLMIEVSLDLNSLRLYAVSLAGIILLIWSFDQAPKIRSYTMPVMSVGVICLAVWQTISAYTVQPRKILLPAGTVATSQRSYDKLSWLMEHTKPGQLFFQAAWPGVYLPLHLNNPAFVDQLYPGDQSRPEEVELTIQQLDSKQVPYVLWAARLGSMDDLKRQPKDHLGLLRAYLHDRYSQVHSFPDGDQVWQRNITTNHP